MNRSNSTGAAGNAAPPEAAETSAHATEGPWMRALRVMWLVSLLAALCRLAGACLALDRSVPFPRAPAPRYERTSSNERGGPQLISHVTSIS